MRIREIVQYMKESNEECLQRKMTGKEHRAFLKELEKRAGKLKYKIAWRIYINLSQREINYRWGRL